MKRILAVLLLVCGVPFALLAAGADSQKFQALKYRNLGPSRGGRSSAVVGVPGQVHTFYMGNAGGVWKSVNAGQSWENVSDGFFESSSIGAIAVADSDPNVIYVGTGQGTLRGNVAMGVGMYRSTDAGKTWTHIGLRNAGQIGRVRVHPTDPNLVYAAVIGNPFVPNEDRGLYRSRDGGKNWERILYISTKTGVVDLAMDAVSPRVLYAAAWTGQRKPWTIVSGSEEGALYKSTDGGDTWLKLSGGLPQGVVGKIGVAVSPANPNRVWALVEANDGGLFRSDDAGQNWKRLETNQKRRLYQRAWYYMHIIADPRDEQKVYILNVDEFRSRDGGQTFETISVPHGDGHDLWIHPQDTRVMIMGTDGGASVTLDDGANWSTLLNQPTAEMYYVEVDGLFPYNVYGAQQDNSTIKLPSRDSGSLTPYEHWRNLGGGESGHIGFDFHTPDIVYAGSYGGEITRLNVKTGEIRMVMAYPQMEIGLAAKDLRYRFNWNTPLRVSVHNPKEIYFCSQYVHRSTDEGQSWEVISPDLSRNEKSRQDYSGEPITYENTGIEVYSNILSFEESPVKAGVFWAGSDDGLVHVSIDHGKTWSNVTPPKMPEWGQVNGIEASQHDPARALLAVHKYKLGDPRPYIFLTNDTGKTWTLLTDGKNGIGPETPTRAVREDPVRKGLLYAGTERGVYVSLNDGRTWASLQLNLPIIPVNDIRVAQNDLVLATQGRSYWILDDITVLQQWASGAIPEKTPALLKPRDTYRMRMEEDSSNPPNGALIFYNLPEEMKSEMSLTISDAQDHVIQKFFSERYPQPNPDFPYDFMGGYSGSRKVSRNVGLNRFVWDLKTPPVDFPPGTIVWGYLGGVRVAPGAFKVTLSSGDWSQSQTFQVLKDPRAAATQQDLDEQYAFALGVRDQLNRIYSAVRTLRSVRQQGRDAAKRLGDAGKDALQLTRAADALWDKLGAIEGELMQPKNEADQDTENFPTKIDNQLAYMYMHLDDTDSRPTEGQKQRVQELEKEIDAQLSKLKAILETDVPAFNKLASESGLGTAILQ